MVQDVGRMLERIMGGDREAAAWLYDHYAPYLFRNLRRRYTYLGAADLEDLLHATFLMCFRDDFRVLKQFCRRQGLPSASALGRFLWDRCCGVVANYKRLASVTREVSLDDREQAQPGPSVERQIVDRDVLARLDDCLRCGDQRVYLYFKLRYRDGFSPEEIRQIGNWPAKTTYKLKDRLNKAVRRCGQKLGLFVY